MKTKLKTKTQLLLLISVLMIFATSCEDDDEFELGSELPESLIGYQVVIYNTDVISNPDDLYVSSRTVYYFEDQETVRGEGDDGSSLPTTSWEWTGGDPDEIFDTATLDLYYGDNGQERFVINWDGYEKALEERQTFTGYYALAGSATVEVEGYFEIERVGSGGNGDTDNPGGGDNGTDEGDLTFWTDDDYGCGDIYVEVESEGTETISGYFDSGNPGCDAPQSANFYDLPYGTYSYTANSDGDCIWSGSFTIGESCTTIELTDNGGGGDDGPDEGDLTFWMNEDLGCGSVYVELESQGTETVSVYYTSGNPGCDAQQSANFYDLPYDTYNYTADSDGDCIWSGSVSIDSQCQTILLTD